MATIKLDGRTIEILKNFSTINSNFYCSGGNTLQTISVLKNILSKAEVDVDFPEFGIYDLSGFLGALSTIKNSLEISFEPKKVVMSGFDSLGNPSVTKWDLASKEILTSTGIKDLDLPDPCATLSLSAARIKSILATSNTLGVEDIVFRCDGESVEIGVFDKTGLSGAENFTTIDGADSSIDFEFYFLKENLKLLPMDYEIAFSENGVAHFKGSNSVEYWIAMEADSTHGTKTT
jgi:hypothetical protein